MNLAEDRIAADDYLIYYKDNVNYATLYSELNKFKSRIPKRDFLELMGVNSKSRIQFGVFKKGGYLFTEEYERKCKYLSRLLAEYAWTKEPYNAICQLYELTSDGDITNGIYLPLLNKFPNYVEKYKFLLKENEINPQFESFIEDLCQFDEFKPLDVNKIVQHKWNWRNEEYERTITFQTLAEINKIYDALNVVAMQ